MLAARRTLSSLTAVAFLALAILAMPIKANAKNDMNTSISEEGMATLIDSDGLARKTGTVSEIVDLAMKSGEFEGNSWRFDNGTPILAGKQKESIDSGGALQTLPQESIGWGIDVSRWNGTIDWSQVRDSGIDFAILRGGYGRGGVDEEFKANVAGCKANDIKFGVYFYAYSWDEASAADEAEQALVLLADAGVTPSDLALPVYYDMENEKDGKPAGVDYNNQYVFISGSDAFAGIAKSWARVIQANGYRVGFYSSLNWWNNYLTDPVFEDWDRWVAQYNRQLDYKGTFSIWQYTSGGTVSGINGRTDMNYLYNSHLIGGSAGGTAITGTWEHRNGKWYFIDSATGTYATGEHLIEGKWYWLDPNNGGARVSGFVRLPSFKTVYYDADGAMRYGEQFIDGKWYYFDVSTGAMKRGFQLLSDGSVKKWVYYAVDGHMLYNEQYINGGWYYLNPVTGAVTYDFVLLPTSDGGRKWVYYGPVGGDGRMRYGEQLINGGWYYLDPNTGAVTYGLVYLSDGDKWVYYGPEMGDGRMRYGEQLVDGVQRYFDPITGAADKIGYQNIAGHYQVSTRTVKAPQGIDSNYSYITPSRITLDASRDDCVDAVIARAFEYVGTPYREGLAAAPGVGIDAVGLVLQSLYAAGMDLTPLSPWDYHSSNGSQAAYVAKFWQSNRFGHVEYSLRKRGDLIVHDGSIAILTGNDRAIEATPTGVKEVELSQIENIEGLIRPFD